MIKIKLKDIEFDSDNGQKIKTSYKELLGIALRNTPANGITIGEIESRLKILAEIEKSKDTLVIDDISHEILVNAVNLQRFVIVSDKFVEYKKDIENADIKSD